MARQSARLSRRRTICRRTTTAAVALIASAAVCSPAVAAGGSPTIVVAGDSVLATSLPTFGSATIQATRPDALTGKPVVIGQYSGYGNPLMPFSVNTTTPTPLSGSGDCWQKGALSQALTPDLQPGDTVTLTQAGLFGGTPSTTSVLVRPSGPNALYGPLSGCDSIAPWARNAITSAPSAVTDGPITVSGVAQPLATGVAVSASDGTHVGAPASVTPAADGSWSATIPVEHLARLANAPLTVTPVFAVPDVSTGVPAHIVGVAASVKKAVPAPDTSQRPAPTGGHAQEPSPTGKPTGGHHPRPTRKPRVTGLRSASSLTLAAVRSHGLTASFLVPAGTKTVEVELLHGSKPTYQTILRADKAGSQQTVWLGDSRLYRLLRRGHYTIAVRAGTSRSTLGAATTRGLTIR
jgi:hypothetical protein